MQVQCHSTNFYIELTFVVYLKVFKFYFVLLNNFTVISHGLGFFFIYIQSQNVQHSKDMTLASNRSLAEGNLLYQPKLESLKSNLTEKYQELQVLFEAYQIKKTKLDRQSSNASLETLLALLQTEGAKIEEDTEVMTEHSSSATSIHYQNLPVSMAAVQS